MPIKNSYPGLPEIAYERTAIDMKLVAAYAISLVGRYNREVIKMAFCIFLNESARGTKGVNNNYAGIQADCGRWSGLTGEIGTSVRRDSGGVIRRFICFGPEGYKDTLNLLAYACNRRGMYIGAAGVRDTNSLGVAYLTKWVGRKALVADSGFDSLYREASRIIGV